MKRFICASASALLLMTGAIAITATPSQAQFANVKQELKSLPNQRISFAPGKSSKKIEGFENTIYLLRARKGQTLTLKINSLGARASVTLYGTNGKALSPVYAGSSGEGKVFSVKLPSNGDYYIVGGSGPTNHLHGFTVTIR